MAKARYHHGELRGALLDAAEALVRERGVGGWSLREVSSVVGVSASAAYHHFASREALVRALAARVLAQLGERMGQAAAAEPGRGLVAACRAYVRWALEDPAVRLALNAGGGGTPIAPHPHDVLDAELDRLVAEGELGAPSRPGAEFVVWAAVHGLTTLLADGLVTLDEPDGVERETERVVQAVLTGLARETPPPKPWPAPHSAHTRRRSAQPGTGGS
ncbi:MULTISPECIES: TetR/AcrR family transcriptional regulator [Amycolatopsis]|uniref:DNA-binding transcriptional regulator, AcrR family n=2 Tax=Amycolatopsis TaxID=1813 RepID=A0A1I3T7V8_9PSEU|nr:TetR/AcrR family transcriptional regulator [Amycolatopsis sacchari]SFJ65756.1 DNA-binding transcriptional regulator, AcrR family [Amycolatopsis sacchari]